MVLLWSLHCAVFSKDFVEADLLVVIVHDMPIQYLREIIMSQSYVDLFDVFYKFHNNMIIVKIWVLALLLFQFRPGLLLFFFLLFQFEQMIQVSERWHSRFMLHLKWVFRISWRIWVNIVKAHILNSTVEVDDALLKFEDSFVSPHHLVKIVVSSPWQDGIAQGKLYSDPPILREIDGEKWIFFLWFIIVIILFLLLLFSLLFLFASHNIYL